MFYFLLQNFYKNFERKKMHNGNYNIKQQNYKTIIENYVVLAVIYE